ncbi:MAG: lmo0937 family membrane protein [Acidobacteria bacterium]|nr:MAG: lmo0937 family membrane protein [Acidobacteriota bacterium]
MFTILFIVLLVAWLLGWGVFHVASGLVHRLLIVAVISLILHFVRGARGPAGPSRPLNKMILNHVDHGRWRAALRAASF